MSSLPSVAPAGPAPTPLRLVPGRRTAGLALALTVLLPLAGAACLVFALTSRSAVRVVEGYRAGNHDLDGLYRASDAIRVAGAGMASFSLAVLVVFLIWSWQTFANARLISSSAPGTGWAIGGWLIPVVNLVAPAYNLARVDRVSGGSGVGARPLIVIWGVLDSASLLAYQFGTEDAAAMAVVRVDQRMVDAMFLLTGAAVAAVFMVRSMTSRQQLALATHHERGLEIAARRSGDRPPPTVPVLEQAYGPAARTASLAPPPQAPNPRTPIIPTYGQTRRAPLAELPEDGHQH